MTERDEHETSVKFRKWRKKNGGIIALFPEIPSDIHGYYNMSYEHVGQHGGADFSSVIARTVPATAEESADLKRELESIGYNLQAHQCQTAAMREACRRAAREVTK